MPCALSAAVRLQIVEQVAKGSTLIDVAEANQLSYSTLRNIYKRYIQEGIQGLAPLYSHCGRPAPEANSVIYRAALWLKRRHPDWGAGFIHMVLKDRYEHAALPAERTLLRWFKKHGLAKHNNPLVLSKPQWADEVHDIWQIDAKEKLRLPSGQRLCYLSVVDERSGCLLKAAVFPPLSYQ